MATHRGAHITNSPERSPSSTTSGSVDVLIFFFNDPAPTEIYTLSLHDALPICQHARPRSRRDRHHRRAGRRQCEGVGSRRDRKSTRLNSSHANISYAVFCLKKKNDTPACTTSHPPVPPFIARYLALPTDVSTYF